MISARKYCGSIRKTRVGGARVALGLLILFMPPLKPMLQGQSFTVLYTFQGGVDGGYPIGGLIQDKEGNLYGTTTTGGTGCSGGCGTVFRLDPKGKKTTVYSFRGTGNDGKHPYASLTFDPAGNLYGTTYEGGAPENGCGGNGCGTVFRVNKNGKETVLYSFTGGLDGATPFSGVTVSKRTLYGTTHLGGANNWGTLFALDKSGERVVYSFNGPTGGDPQGGVIRDAEGNFYGLTEIGGINAANCDGFGCGTVFQVTPDGTENVLYYFTGGADGNWPGQENVLRDAAGNLYGTSQGPTPDGFGTIFKVSPAGEFTILHTFSGGAGGGNPWAGLVADEKGNLYGTTVEGGGAACDDGCGTVFVLEHNGNFRVLHQFTGGADGAEPFTGLILDAAGNLYGVTNAGGVGVGVVFKITP